MRSILRAVGLAVAAIAALSTQAKAECRCVHIYIPGQVDVWEDTCSDGCPPYASLTGNTSDFRTVPYDHGGDSLHDSISVIDKHSDGWVVFYKDVGYGGDTLCVGPHASYTLSGGSFNDRLDGVKFFSGDQCSGRPPAVHCGFTVYGWSDGPLCKPGCD